MFELIFIACLVGQPERCEEKALQYADIPSPMACMMNAQPQLAEWIEQHPRWRIAKWSCRAWDEREYRA